MKSDGLGGGNGDRVSVRLRVRVRVRSSWREWRSAGASTGHRGSAYVPCMQRLVLGLGLALGLALYHVCSGAEVDSHVNACFVRKGLRCDQTQASVWGVRCNQECGPTLPCVGKGRRCMTSNFTTRPCSHEAVLTQSTRKPKR